MRYLVQDVVLDKNHIKYPNRTVYYLLDLQTRRLSAAYHLTYDRAKEIADRKNGYEH